MKGLLPWVVLAAAFVGFGCTDQLPTQPTKPGNQTITNGSDVNVIVIICNGRPTEVRKGQTCPEPSPSPSASPGAQDLHQKPFSNDDHGGGGG